MSVMIQIKNLFYDYADVRALDDVSFSIPAGSLTALVGPNGSGKTTLMECMAGLRKPYSGSIHVSGIDVIEHPREVHRKIGFLPDFFGLYDNLTVERSLLYFARAYELDEEDIDFRISELLELLNLANKRKARVSGLSRGMRQRLGIGQAMIHSPELLILDEPASGLDPEARHSLSELFLDLNKNGVTLVVSSHILAELDRYANNLLILRKGRIVDHEIAIQENKVTGKIIVSTIGTSVDLTGILNEHSMVSNISATENITQFDFSGNQDDQHELLKILLNRGIPVLDFHRKKSGIEEQYLMSVKQ